jgi:hypothetical protein
MPKKKSEYPFYPPILTRDAMQEYKAWPHLRILVVLADNFVYFKTNRVNKFEIQDLAKLCGVGRLQTSKSLKYLRENHYLITIGDEEFVNPRFCFQCGEQNYKALLEEIVDERSLYINNVMTVKPSYWPKFDFRKTESAKEGDADR